MSDFMKIMLKEFSQDLNNIQSKTRDISKKFDVESKMKIMNEIKIIKDKATEKVKKYLLTKDGQNKY